MLPFYVLIYTEPRSVHSKPRSRSSAAPESAGSHPAVLSPSISLSLSNAFLFMDFRTLFYPDLRGGPQRSAATPYNQLLTHSFPCNGGVGGLIPLPTFKPSNPVLGSCTLRRDVL